MVGNPINVGSSSVSRRLFLKVAAATGIIAGISSSTIAQQTEITVEGRRNGWVGRSPDGVAGKQNPTLQLKSGNTYTLTWENADGRKHNIAIADTDGNVIERTPIMEQEGATRSLEFTATSDMSTYYCEVHPESMRGAIEVDGSAPAEPQTDPTANSNTEAGSGTCEDQQPGETEGSIDLSYQGRVTYGNPITITATDDGDPVVNATVEVKDGDGDRQYVGQTDENGQITVTVPKHGDKAGELNVRVRKGEREGELEVEDDS